MPANKQPIYPFLSNLSTLQIRAILFLDNEGNINHVPHKLTAFRKAIKAELKRRLEVEIKYIIKKHPDTKNVLYKDLKKLSPVSFKKQLKKISMHKLQQLKKRLLESRKHKK